MNDISTLWLTCYIINHAAQVEADFYLFVEVAADGYSMKSEMMAASSVKHREGWASWFEGLLVIITAYTLCPYNNRVESSGLYF